MDGVSLHIGGVYPGVHHRVAVQQADFRVRIQLPDFAQHIVVEGGIHHPPLHIHFPFQLDQLIPNAGILDLAVFDLHVYGHAAVAQHTVDLPQGGDSGEGICLHAAGKVQLFQLLAGHIHHPALAVAGSVHPFVVDHHQLAVLGKLHIQLNAVRSLLHGQPKGRNGIFGRISTGASMGPNLCCHRLLPPWEFCL